MKVIENPIRRLSDRIFGDGPYSTTVPIMDGSLKPNSELDKAKVAARIASPDNLIASHSCICFSSGNVLYRMGSGGSGEFEARWETKGDITALAAGPGAVIALATEASTIEILDSPDAGQFKRLLIHDVGTKCVTSLTFISSSKLAVCIGSKTNVASDWARDLMSRNASGSVCVFDLDNGSLQTLEGDLAYPSGLLLDGDNLLVSEAWRSRIIEININGEARKPRSRLEYLPAYPSRLARVEDGFWLCLFAPRSQLIELVLREKRYRKRMLEEIEPELWIAPKLRSNDSMHEPMQGGALRHLGYRKPWAPSLSYGLVAKLDREFRFVKSLHSRADGDRHGITSVVPYDGYLFISSKGGDVIIAAQ